MLGRFTKRFTTVDKSDQVNDQQQSRLHQFQSDNHQSHNQPQVQHQATQQHTTDRHTVYSHLQQHAKKTAQNLIIFKVRVRNAKQNRDVFLSVTMTGLQEDEVELNGSLEGTLAASTVAMYKSFLDIHGVRFDPINEKALYVYVFKRSLGIEYTSKLKGNLMKSNTVKIDDLVQTRQYVCPDAKSRFDLMFLLEHGMRRAWQYVCEKPFRDDRELIMSPEVYQFRSFVMKINRKGQIQDRVLVLSSTYLYNIECSHTPTVIRARKWALPIQSLKQLVLSGQDQTPMLDIDADATVIESQKDDAHTFQKNKVKSSHLFRFRRARDLLDLVSELSRLFFARTNRTLKVEAFPDFERTLYQESIASSDSGSMQGYLLKYTKNGVGKPHRRFVTLKENGILEWADSATSGRLRGVQVINYSTDIGQNTLQTDDDSALERSFVVRTLNKQLVFTADTIHEFDLWIQKLDSITSALKSMATVNGSRP